MKRIAAEELLKIKFCSGYGCKYKQNIHRVKPNRHLLLTNKKFRQRLILSSFDCSICSNISLMCKYICPNSKCHTLRHQQLQLKQSGKKQKETFPHLFFFLMKKRSFFRNLQLISIKSHCHTFIPLSHIGIEKG